MGPGEMGGYQGVSVLKTKSQDCFPSSGMRNASSYSINQNRKSQGGGWLECRILIIQEAEGGAIFVLGEKAGHGCQEWVERKKLTAGGCNARISGTYMRNREFAFASRTRCCRGVRRKKNNNKETIQLLLRCSRSILQGQLHQQGPQYLISLWDCLPPAVIAHVSEQRLLAETWFQRWSTQPKSQLPHPEINIKRKKLSFVELKLINSIFIHSLQIK